MVFFETVLTTEVSLSFLLFHRYCFFFAFGMALTVVSFSYCDFLFSFILLLLSFAISLYRFLPFVAFFFFIFFSFYLFFFFFFFFFYVVFFFFLFFSLNY